MTRKILFVVNVDWFFISHRLPLAFEALKKGYEVHIACRITDKRKYLECLGLKVHCLNISRSGIDIISEAKTFIEMYRILKEINPNIVHFVTIKPVLYGGIASRFLSIRKKVFSITGLGFVFIKQGIKASFVRILIKIMYRFALGGKNSHVIVQNQDDKEVVNSISSVQITLVRGSGVDLDQFNYIEENNGQIKVSMACRLLKDKGVFEYVEAAKIIKNKGIKAYFELYGDVDLDNPSSLTNDNIEQIKEDGFVSVFGFRSQISKIFSHANIVVLPSYREGLPKVLIEAAACGRAVVTTDVPGCRDAIEINITGLLCKVKDVNSLALSIEKLILDNELRNDMGRAGIKLAKKEFDINHVVKKHFEIYEDQL